MGLDMYLYEEKEIINDEIIKSVEKLCNFKAKSIIVEREVMYWRKCNAIHNWFVMNVQHGVDDCKPYFVSSVKLKKLYFDIQEQIKKPDMEILVPVSGFFFGGIEKDKWYWKNLKRTLDCLKKELIDDKDDKDYYYRSSW